MARGGGAVGGKAYRIEADRRGAAMAVIVNPAEAALLRVNRGRRAWQLTVSDVLMAQFAVAEDVGHMAYLELEGHTQKAAGCTCAMTAPRLCRRSNSLRNEAVDGVLCVGESGVLVREMDGVPAITARLAM